MPTLNPLHWVKNYTHWLHTRWPAGKPEKLPIADDEGRTNVDGLYIVGDLTGVPLLKLSATAGVEAVRKIKNELEGTSPDDDVVDVAIIGGGTSGFAAALEAEKLGLKYVLLEASEPFSTIVNFPKGKPIFKYPTETPIEGDIELHEKSDIKEGLIEDLREQTVDQGLKWIKARATHVERSGGLLEVVLGGKPEQPEGVHLNGTSFVLQQERIKAKRVVVGIGRSGNYRKLGVPGEKLDKVYNRLHDPADYCGTNVLIVGGGDSAMETAISLAKCGAAVTLSYRKPEFNRPKPENIESLLALSKNPDADVGVEQSDDPRQSSTYGDFMHEHEKLREGGVKGSVNLLMASNVAEIRENEVDIKLQDGETATVKNDSVFAMIGREPPLDFFRKSNVRILGERTTWWWVSLIGFLIFCVWLYHWKGASDPGKPLFGIDGLYMPEFLQWNPAGTWEAITGALGGFGEYLKNPATIGGSIVAAAGGRSFYYSLAYCLCVVIFGVRRVRRRRTPYVFWQTLTLAMFQCLPLFILPEILLPYGGRNGWFESGAGLWLQNTFFPGESWWRAYGFVLAWPLMAWNWFTGDPIWGWVVLGTLQTFVLIPAMIWFWGKGSYCGWICSCGALAETLGDTHRHKMPHGPFWNRFNMLGQVFLAFALILQVIFVLKWMGYEFRYFDGPYGKTSLAEYIASHIPLFSWAYMVDLIWAGIVGVGLYFWFSGRVWCRFACPLAALMHIYHRFSRFAIVAEKKKCISCNVCTSVCHQGIDVMSFANKGLPMKDPECVRCSACVQSCPTGVLSFGMVDGEGNATYQDPKWLAASPVRMRESAPVQMTVNGKAQ